MCQFYRQLLHVFAHVLFITSLCFHVTHDPDVTNLSENVIVTIEINNNYSYYSNMPRIVAVDSSVYSSLGQPTAITACCRPSTAEVMTH